MCCATGLMKNGNEHTIRTGAATVFFLIIFSEAVPGGLHLDFVLQFSLRFL